MSSQWAYEMSNEILINEFAQACAQSGVSNSGLIIDITGSVYAEKARYLKGALLARLEGVKPPFKLGDIVQTRRGGGNAHSIDWLWEHTLPRDPHQIIRRIHYAGNESWLLEFRGIPEGEREYARFNANDFILEPSVITIGK